MTVTEPLVEEQIPPQPTATVPPTHVWLVDDDQTFRGLLSEYLQRQEDIRCVRDFSSPDGALSALASQTGPDVIVMDVHMGDRNGLDAIGPIKSLSRNTQVLMLTSLSDPIGRTRALNEGASDFLLKSYTPEEIVACIRNPHRRVHARRRKTSAANTGASGRLTNLRKHGSSRTTQPASLLKGSLSLFRKFLT
jgi:DNA-binding NarL/FixJ family response regulator